LAGFYDNRLCAFEEWRAAHPKAMAVILDEGNYGRWLAADWADAARLVAAYPSQLMAAR